MHCTRPRGEKKIFWFCASKKHAVEITAVIPHAGSNWRQLATISINKTWVISGRFATAYWQIFKSDRNAIYRKPSLSHQRVTLVHLRLSLPLSDSFHYISVGIFASQVRSHSEDASVGRLAGDEWLTDVIRMTVLQWEEHTPSFAHFLLTQTRQQGGEGGEGKVVWPSWPSWTFSASFSGTVRLLLQGRVWV